MLFALIAHDKPNGLADRMKARPDHLEFLKSLGDSLKLAGALLDSSGDMSGSLLVIEAEDQAAAEAALGKDPYLLSGVFASSEIRPYRVAINQMGDEMAHWLMKSEPDVFGWDDLVKKDSPEEWHGVRNYTARNNMMAMKLGEEAFFYHSNIGKEIVGIMKVVALAHPDSTAEPNPNGKIVWQCVDVAPVKPFKRPVTLEDIKAEPKLSEMALVKLSRLSVQPVTEAEWKLVCKMGGL